MMPCSKAWRHGLAHVYGACGLTPFAECQPLVRFRRIDALHAELIEMLALMPSEAEAALRRQLWRSSVHAQ